MAKKHFVNLLGTSSVLSQTALDRLLDKQTTKISVKAQQIMEEPISLAELHLAAQQLARNKVPNKDGLPIEFFLALWDELGPILLEVL